MADSFQQVAELAQALGLLRPRDLLSKGIPRATLTRMVREGRLTRVSRGLYALPSRLPSEHGTLAEVARRLPRSVVCLLSALRFHGLTTQAPFEVWIAIPDNYSAPRMEYPPLRVIWASSLALSEGVEEHLVDGIAVRITSVPRTVADCFKFRNKIGLDVALEALQEAWREHRTTMDDLWRAAELCRVAKVMRPYMESLS